MKTMYGMAALAACVLLLVSGCATVSKPTVKNVAEGPVVSPTLQESADSSKRGLKRKVAIARFTNESKYGQSLLLDRDDDRIGKQAVDILSDKLLDTDKFILLERADLAKIQDELAAGDYQALNNRADYLIVGSVTEFGRKEQGEVGIFSRTRRQIAFAKVYVRLIDVKTQRILYAEEGVGEAFSEAGSVFGVGERAGYDSTLNDRAIDAAITDLASNIIENLLDRPWRSYILDYSEGQVVIAGGRSQNIRPGDQFEVIRQGKEVVNPQTNTRMRLPGTTVATIEASSLAGDTPEAEVTFCRVVSGSLEEYAGGRDFSSLYVEELN